MRWTDKEGGREETKRGDDKNKGGGGNDGDRWRRGRGREIMADTGNQEKY